MSITYKIQSRVTGLNDIDEYEDESMTYMVIRLDDPDPSDEDIQEWKQELYDEYRHECSCEHDCCGHWFGGVRDILQKYENDRQYWIVSVISQRNY